MSEINIKIIQKYEALGENPDTYLRGLLHSKPINYWDYIEVDTLLSLQKPRTHFKDESIFIMYHQVTELTLKMMIHEAKQIVEEEFVSEEFLMTKNQSFESVYQNAYHFFRYHERWYGL